MFSKKIIIVILIYISGISAAGCTGKNNCNLTDMSGEVFYNSSPAANGITIENDGVISTGINSFAVLSNDKNRVFLFPESEIKIADVNKEIYSISAGEAVFVNNSFGSVRIQNGSMQLKIARGSIFSILKSGNYFEICVIRKTAELISGDKEITLPVNARSAVSGDKVLSSKPLSIIEINKLQSISGITNAGDLTRFYKKNGNLPDSKLAELYLQFGKLSVIKTRDGKEIIGSMAVTGNSTVIKTEHGELKIKSSEILSVQIYDKF